MKRPVPEDSCEPSASRCPFTTDFPMTTSVPSAASSPPEPTGNLQLGEIRDALIRQEDTIIFALIERSQFRCNDVCYEPGADAFRQVTGSGDSFLDFMLLETERLQARVRRYTAPEENAFFPERLPLPALPVTDMPHLLYAAKVNLNRRIMELYLNKVRPAICEAGADGQHGSSVVADVNALQAISKRVHYGKFVAEAKFRAEREEYSRLIAANDEEGIMTLLTNKQVELRVLARVRRKATIFGQDIDADEEVPPTSANGGAKLKLDPEAIVQLYRDFIIPLTKEAEVAYLLQRLGNTRVAFQGAPGGFANTLARSWNFGGAVNSPPSLLPMKSAGEVFSAVMSNQAFYGIVVLERGDAGIDPTTRTLLRNTSLKVVAELTHRAAFRLVSRVPLLSVRKVYGRGDALRQCGNWLLMNLPVSCEQTTFEGEEGEAPWARRLDDPENLEAAFLVERSHSPLPMPCSIVDVDDDAARERTRCIVVSKRTTEAEPTGNDKTLALFALKDEPGQLANALATFNKHAVNLLYIQSSADGRPASKATFYVEMQGHSADPKVDAALSELSRSAEFIKVLGSFPTTPSPLTSA